LIDKILSRNLLPPENYIWGFADLRGLLIKKFDGYNYGISIGKRLNNYIVDELDDGPTMEYYHHYNTINSDLEELSLKIQTDLSRKGFSSLAIRPTISSGSEGYDEYMEALSYDISHKMVATRAGLGWIGKTDLFVSGKFGPRLRLVTILLKEDPGHTAKPVDQSMCGKCNLCVVKCPAKAANGELWNINIHRDEFFDAFKCRQMCGELARQKLGVEERICGLCVSVCPYGRKN
jgi:epoxyqueuosine reductase QueG